jgi:hypothetical protein
MNRFFKIIGKRYFIKCFYQWDLAISDGGLIMSLIAIS